MPLAVPRRVASSASSAARTDSLNQLWVYLSSLQQSLEQLRAEVAAGGGGGPGATDHGALTGLADDDHPQYLNNTRGDARYSQLAHGHSGVFELAGAVAAHAGAADPHPAYLTTAEGNAAYEAIGAVAAHAGAADPHPAYLTAAEGNAAYEAIGAVAAHAGAADPHPTYLTAAEGAALVTAHAAAADPHPTYLTAAEGNAAYEAIGAVAAHAGAADPHPTYLTAAEGNALYAPIGGGGGGGPAVGVIVATLPKALLEHTETIALAACLATSEISIAIAQTSDTDENCAEMLDVLGMSATPLDGQVGIQLAFLSRQSGPIRLAYTLKV